MIGESHLKGDRAEIEIAAECLERGYKIAVPYGQNWRFDLIVERADKLERIQCKFVESDGNVICVKCRSRNGATDYMYTEKDFDWLAIFDKTTDACYFVPSTVLGEGKQTFSLRLTKPANNQKDGIRWARDFLDF